MAYLFMTDGEEYIDGTWEPEGGENAVVLQPGGAPVETSKLSTGPTLYRMVKKLFHSHLVPEICEYAVRLSYGEDPLQTDEEGTIPWSENEAQEPEEQLGGNKLGGTRSFYRAPEFSRCLESGGFCCSSIRLSWSTAKQLFQDLPISRLGRAHVANNPGSFHLLQVVFDTTVAEA